MCLCNQLSIPIAPDKTFGPSTTLTFAGIELDTIKAEAHLPWDKIAKCIETIKGLLKRKKATIGKVAIDDWATKFHDECDNARDRFSQALLQSHSRCDKSTPFYPIVF